LEEGRLVFTKNPFSMLKYSNETDQRFSKMETERKEIAVDNVQNQNAHHYVASRFFNLILIGEGQLMAEGWEGPRSLVLANGIMLSSFTGQTVKVPFDNDIFEEKLKELANSSKFVKKQAKAVSQDEDMSKSFGSHA
jgi:hypothetical protein